MNAADGAIIGGIVTAIIGALATAVVKVLGARHENSESSSKRTLDEAFKLLSVKDREIQEGREERQELREELSEIGEKHNNCEVNLARAQEKQDAANRRIAAMEKFLSDMGYTVPDIGFGTGPHRALPAPKPNPSKES
jgi:septal ring factor EnvC (AmiA/AmiB activator)